MAVDPSLPGTPGWWLIRLGRRLAADEPRLNALDAYAEGRHPLPYGNRKMRTTYRQFQKMARANFTGLVSESVRERLRVDGFSTGSGGDTELDRDSWARWQRNSMDADSGLVHKAALDMSRSYVIVGRDDNGQALITPEDPRQVIAEMHPVYRRRVRAALKTYTDDVDGTREAVVYLPDGVWYFTASMEASGDLYDPARWSLDEDEGDGGYAPPVLDGTIPVVPFVNRPRLAGGGLGEFEDVIDIQDRINTTLLDRMVVAAMQAYRQRWAKGLSLTDENGNAEAPFDPGADLLWAVENDTAAFGDFQAADLRQMLDAAKEDIRQLAAISRTPPHYLVGELNNVNGETLKATETGLVAKCEDRKRHFGESWEQVARYAAAVEGAEVPQDAEVLWADSESRSMAELADSATKKMAAGVPWRQRMEDLGYSPQQIDRMESERASDALMASLMTPAAPPPPEMPPQPEPQPAPRPGVTVRP